MSPTLWEPDFSPEQMIAGRYCRPMWVGSRDDGWWRWRCRLRCAAPARDGFGLLSAEVAYECAVEHLRRWHEPVECFEPVGRCVYDHFWWGAGDGVADRSGFWAHRHQWFTLFTERVPGVYAVPAQRRLSRGGMSHASEA